MKYFLLFITCISLTLSCELPPPDDILRTNVSILFIDRSLSSNKGDDVRSNENQEIADVLYQSIRRGKDIVWTSNIYGGSSSIANRKKWVFNGPYIDMAELKSLSRREKEAARKEYQEELALFKSVFVKEIMEDISRVPKDQKETDIFGTTIHIKSVLDLYQSNQYLKIIHMFSDMEHCLSNVRQISCDGKNTFSSYKEAKSLGIEDAHAVIEFYDIEDEPFKGIRELHIHLPASELDNDLNPYLPSYYQNLYTTLGIEQVLFH